MNEYWDNSIGAVSDPLYNWMSTDLSGTTNYKIVIGHDPLYPLKKHVGNSLDANKANRDRLQALFVAQNVGVFLGGHTHYSSVQNKNGVFHVATGVIGSGTSQGEDSFATITYTYVDSNGKLVLTQKHDKSNSWSNPIVETTTVS